MQAKKLITQIAAVVLWTLIWQLASAIIGNSLVLAGPWDAIIALVQLLPLGVFWQTLLNSFLRIGGGLILAALTAVVLASLSYRVKFVKEFLAPPMSLLKTVPVASFIILMLISLRSKANLSLIISFMMVLPIIYSNVLEGLGNIDGKLLEMARVYKVKPGKKLLYIYTYKTLPYFTAGAKLALGLCWKSGVAAELIGLVQNSIGNELYYAKLELMMDKVFAWTAVIIFLSVFFEALIMWLLKKFKRSLER